MAALIVGGAAWVTLLASFFLPVTSALELPDTPHGEPLRGWQLQTYLQFLAGPFLLFDYPAILVQFPVLALSSCAALVSPGALTSRWWPIGLGGAFICASGLLAALTVHDFFLEPRLIGFWVFIVSLILHTVAYTFSGVAGILYSRLVDSDW